jgi:hypothetical protein
MRFGDGPRRQRMIRGTIARIGELAMRHGHSSQLATLDCTSSRRSTVMCALPRATAVTTVYQRDSSSTRPRPSVVFAARAPTPASPKRCQIAGAASRAARPSGGAFGAPGPRTRDLTQTLLRQQADACRPLPGHHRMAGLDRGSFHISSLRQSAPVKSSGRKIGECESPQVMSRAPFRQLSRLTREAQ